MIGDAANFCLTLSKAQFCSGDPGNGAQLELMLLTTMLFCLCAGGQLPGTHMDTE